VERQAIIIEKKKEKPFFNIYGSNKNKGIVANPK